MATRRSLADIWSDLIDIIGPEEQWPHKILPKIKGQNVQHDMRPIIAAFMCVNGVCEEVSNHHFPPKSTASHL